MRKGDAVIILPSNNIYSQHGIQFAYIVEEREHDVNIRLCCQNKTVLKSPKSGLVVIDYEQIPRELQKFLPENKMSNNELRERLDRIERKLTQIGIKMGFTPTPGDHTAL